MHTLVRGLVRCFDEVVVTVHCVSILSHSFVPSLYLHPSLPLSHVGLHFLLLSLSPTSYLNPSPLALSYSLLLSLSISLSLSLSHSLSLSLTLSLSLSLSLSHTHKHSTNVHVTPLHSFLLPFVVTSFFPSSLAHSRFQDRDTIDS